jgi:hypothetical protein
MVPTISKTAQILSIALVILATIASAGGLLLDRLYRDNLFVTSAWKGNDVITLFVAVPLLVTAIIYANRGSQRSLLLWMGVLDYMLYNSAFYLFGAAFNWFFLIYTAMFGLSIFALIFGLVKLDMNGIIQAVRQKMPIKWIAAYMLFVATGLTVIYVIQSLGFIFTGEIPAIVTLTGHPTSIVFALDLTLLVPFLVLGAFWLLRRKAWGFVLAGICTIKGALYTLVLTAGSLWASNAGVEGAGSEVPLWLTLTALGLAACSLFYGNMKNEKSPESMT